MRFGQVRRWDDRIRVARHIDFPFSRGRSIAKPLSGLRLNASSAVAGTLQVAEPRQLSQPEGPVRSSLVGISAYHKENRRCEKEGAKVCWFQFDGS
jgi:hypothetical protein